MAEYDRRFVGLVTERVIDFTIHSPRSGSVMLTLTVSTIQGMVIAMTNNYSNFNLPTVFINDDTGVDDSSKFHVFQFVIKIFRFLPRILVAIRFQACDH